uniref:Expansin-like EG45 domain-containing protein n=1 Tax=Kalanchoe fedtschenkoi TaxID=63787 RepID=A0A7N0U6N4_KALFE
MAQISSMSVDRFSAAVVIILVACGLVGLATASVGTTTFYTGPYVPSACYGNEDHRVMIAAASEEFWDNGRACGRMYDVKCLGGTNEGTPHPCRRRDAIRVKIVDLCPAGCRGTIDLSSQVFAAIADPDAGVIRVSYEHH